MRYTCFREEEGGDLVIGNGIVNSAGGGGERLKGRKDWSINIRGKNVLFLFFFWA